MKKTFVIFVYFALVLSTLLIFWQVRNFGFVNFDDNAYVYENQHVLSGLTWNNIVWAFTTGFTGNWHPLTWLSLMLDCRLFGPSPGEIHLINVLFHIANTLLLFILLKKMTSSLWPSAFVAAAFAFHPMHVESVAWIAERKDVLSTFFGMLTLLAYIGYVRRPSAYRYFLTLAVFALGLMAKPMLVTLPFVLLLLDYWPLDRISPAAANSSGRRNRKTDQNNPVLIRLIIEKIPFFVFSAISSVITFLVQRSGGAVSDINTVSLGQRAANVFLSYTRYIGKMFWPQNLAIFYYFDAKSIWLWQIVLCALLLLVISIFVIYFGRRYKYLLVGWFWFVGTLIPVIGLVQVGGQAIADRYTYIPYIGLFVMIAWGIPEMLSRWPYRKTVVGTVMVAVLATLAVLTYRQVSYWKDNSVLFSHALAVTQNNYISHYSLAEDLRQHGKPAEAIEHYAEAIRINPGYADAMLGLGCALGDQGKLTEAIQYFQNAIRLKPDSGYAQNNLGVALQRQGKLTESAAHFAQAVQSMPDSADARNNLANVLVRQGRLDEAVVQFRAAVRLRPDWPEPMNALAWLIATNPEIKGRDVNEAIGLAARTCELTNFKNPAYLSNLATAYASAGRFADAVETANKALRLAPNSAVAHSNLGNALLSQHKFSEAIGHFKRSLEIEPNNLAVKNNLAWILATSPDPNMRNASEAVRLAQEICMATDYKDPGMLDTLAAAYACSGRFSEAVDTAQKALNLAASPQLKEGIRQHLAFYEQGKPYIEP